MKVRAIQQCKYDGKHRKIGDEFEIKKEIYDKFRYLFEVIEDSKDKQLSEEDLKKKTVKELKEIAKDKSLSGYSKLKEDELIKLILNSQEKVKE